jgi:hypothetical protein
MDELQESIARTNELLMELLRRDDARLAETEQRRKDLAGRLAEDPLKSIQEKMKEARVGEPDHDKRMQEMREKSAEATRKHDEFNQEVLRMMEEQTALLRAIAARLEQPS